MRNSQYIKETIPKFTGMNDSILAKHTKRLNEIADSYEELLRCLEDLLDQVTHIGCGTAKENARKAIAKAKGPI